MSSRSVTALSLGSPLLPSRTSTASFKDSKTSLVSVSILAGMFLMAGTLVAAISNTQGIFVYRLLLVHQLIQL